MCLLCTLFRELFHDFFGLAWNKTYTYIYSKPPKTHVAQAGVELKTISGYRAVYYISHIYRKFIHSSRLHYPPVIRDSLCAFVCLLLIKVDDDDDVEAVMCNSLHMDNEPDPVLRTSLLLLLDLQRTRDCVLR